MVGYEDLIPYLERPTEKYYLQKLITYNKDHHTIKDEVGNIIRKDEVGNISEEWEDIQELSGVIQHRQDEEIDRQGRESTLTYHGIFTPTFNLETDKLSNYRVKFVRDYETLYLFIKEYDPNNFLFDKRHHITLVMELDKKYEGRQK